MRRTFVSALWVMTTVAVGCGAPGDPPNGDPIGTTRSALRGTLQRYSWNQYQSFPTTMMSARDGYCFLTAVSGRFEGAGEAMWIDLDANGNWILTGHSQQNDLNAEATCMPWTVEYGDAFGIYYWYGARVERDQSGTNCALNGTCVRSEVTLWSDSSFCSLSGMGGAFHGDAESITVRDDGTSWKLGATSDAGMTEGWGGCLNTNMYMYRTNEVVWKQGQPAQDLGASNDVVCALTYVAGHFFGAGERVSIEDVNGRWVLSGTSQQQWVEGHARCLVPPIIVLPP